MRPPFFALLLVGCALDATVESTQGSLAVTPDGRKLGYDGLTGRAGLIREESGHTSVLIFAEGLKPNEEYGAHVHAKPCSEEGGGGHYKMDVSVPEVTEENEMWPNVSTNESGDGVGYLRVNHVAREDAASVVIHQVGGSERIACADLTPNAEIAASAKLFLSPLAAAH